MDVWNAYLELYDSNPAYFVGVTLVLLGLLRYVKQLLTCPEVYGRHRFKTGAYEEGSFRRRNLDQLRARSGQFPKPYPNGWYKICESKDLPVGKVVAVSALGREFVVFRGEDGKAGVLNAFCPHLGTHLGHGGKVVGNNLVCPYHLWEFDCDGVNKRIPYCKKDMSGSVRVNAKKYHVIESKPLGAVMFWFDAEGREPQWELHPGLLEVEKDLEKGKMRHIACDDWDDLLLHVFEPSQNSADDFHFLTVHQYLPMPFNLKLLSVAHHIKTEYGKDTPDNDLPREVMMIREKITQIRLFDTIPIPFIADLIVTYVQIQGPNNILFRVDTPLGKFRAHFALLPQEPFRQKASMRMYADRSVPWIVARVLMWWIRETAYQDRQVWEHKSHVSPRNLVIGDGPFAQYGKWLQRFYSEKSRGWDSIVPGGESLDW